MQDLLALNRDQAANVQAGDKDGPGAAFRLACRDGNSALLRELLALTGPRAISVQARLAAGHIAEQPRKDAVRDGASTRQGRKQVVVFRAARHSLALLCGF